MAWFSILFGVVAGAGVMVFQWTPLPRRWRSIDIAWFRARPLFTRLLYLSGIELMCLASIIGGVAAVRNTDWWWSSLLFFAGAFIVLWALFGGPRWLTKRRYPHQQ